MEFTLQGGEPVLIQFDDTLAEPKPERYFTGPRLLLRKSRALPIRAVDLHDRPDRERHDRMIALVRQIDRLVYELYGLSDEEIRLVEAACEA